MQDYTVTIKETLEKVVSATAGSMEEAIEKVCKAYKAEDIVLSADDFASMEVLCSDKEYKVGRGRMVIR